MARHPVNVRIAEAIALLERHEENVTLQSVRANVKIGWDDWSPDQAATEALNQRIARYLRSNGYVISDTATRVRKDYWASTPEELEEQIRIKEESSTFDRNRIRADKAVVAFLKEQRKDFGYEVYPGLFHAEIDRIYSMHGVAAPTARMEDTAA